MNPPSASPLSLLLTLLLLSPGVGFAQEASPASPDVPTVRPEPSTDAPLPGSGENPTPRLLEEPQRPSQDLRILAELGGGMVFGATGVLLVILAGPVLSSSSFVTMTLVGFGTGSALGTYWGGQLLKGRASVTGTFLGMLLGGATGVFIGTLQDAPVLSLIIAPPLMLLGAIIGYEFTERGGPPTRVQPLVSLTLRGASFGLAGTF